MKKFVCKNVQMIAYVILLLTTVGFFIYTLGYSSNWALIVSSTRAANYFNASQQANRLLAQLGFISIVIVVLGLFFGSAKRTTYYLSNIVLSILSSILLLVSAFMTLYYNKVLEVMYRNISELEVPSYLYDIRRIKKSYMIFEFGNVYAYVMIVVGILFGVFLIFKLIAQRDRKVQLQRRVEEAYVNS
ncbi:MAG: hypothetical protein K9L02_02245 [Acholeplasmataceae bacterium]|nr:hypothetical protein [Acholeplasmataceae bacterium]